jgi:hypothetical protein
MMQKRTMALQSILENRWRDVVGYCTNYVAEWQRGNASIRHWREASQEIITLSREAEPREVVEVAVAMYVLAYDQPRLFRSDRAFRFELVRQVRRLGGMNAGIRWGKRVYRELSPRTIEVLAKLLIGAFGTAGVHLGELHQREAEKKRQEMNELHAALARLR